MSSLFKGGKRKVQMELSGDWIEKIVHEVIEEKSVKVTDPKNLDIQGMCSKFPEEFPVFIEIQKGSNNKYEWDVDFNIMVLDRILSSAVFYPYDYGFMPQSLCEDGDPLDVLVMGTNPVLPGVVVKARALGYLDMQDVDKVKDPKTGETKEVLVGDQKILAVLCNDPFFKDMKDLSDVPQIQLDMIKEFFLNYKNLEKKTSMKPNLEKGWKGKKEAIQLIKDTHNNFTVKLEDKLQKHNSVR